jgi:hypothetical protein
MALARSMMLTTWIIYDHPWDFPNNWIVRARDITPGSDRARTMTTREPTKEEAREIAGDKNVLAVIAATAKARKETPQ